MSRDIRTARVLVGRYELSDQCVLDHVALTLNSYERLGMRLSYVLWATDRTPYIPGPEGSILLEFIDPRDEPCATCDVARDAVPYPGLSATNARAIAYEMEQTAFGRDDHPTTTTKAKVAWLRALADQLAKLDRWTR